MNEVSQVRSTSSVALSLSAGKADGTKKLAEKIPAVSAQPRTDAISADSVVALADDKKGAQLQDALGTMHDFVQNVKRELQFSVDQDLGRTVVKVVDSESGDLIRQIPEELFLELARKVKEQGEVNLFDATG
ncbi:MAG TPA: flagellar protein FlaG [Cellvibrionaceae bacterium]